jgi:hypothetical protein
MANLLFALNVTKSIDIAAGATELILGAGFGAALVSTEGMYWWAHSHSIQETALAFQGLVGLEMALNGGTDLSIMFRRRTIDVSYADDAENTLSIGQTFAL